jgi:hypothetical protein
VAPHRLLETTVVAAIKGAELDSWSGGGAGG